jgi:hypothetical protein
MFSWLYRDTRRVCSKSLPLLELASWNEHVNKSLVLSEEYLAVLVSKSAFNNITKIFSNATMRVLAHANPSQCNNNLSTNLISLDKKNPITHVNRTMTIQTTSTFSNGE